MVVPAMRDRVIKEKNLKSHAGFDPSPEVGMDMGIALLYAQVTL